MYVCSETLRQKYFSTCCEKLAQQQSISTIYYQVRRKFIFISIFKLTQKLNEYYALLMGNLICFFFFNFPHLKHKFIFNWRIITSQCCVGLCCTSAWGSHGFTNVPALLNLPPIPAHPSQVVAESQLEFPESYSEFPLVISFTYGGVYASMLFFNFIYTYLWLFWP